MIQDVLKSVSETFTFDFTFLIVSLRYKNVKLIISEKLTLTWSYCKNPYNYVYKVSEGYKNV